MSDDTPHVFRNVKWKSKKDTPQKRGRVYEQEELKRRGARVHPNSGAGPIKDDGSDDTYVYEVKRPEGKQFILKAAELRAVFVRATRQGKMGMWLIHFPKENFTLECRLVPGDPSGIIKEGET